MTPVGILVLSALLLAQDATGQREQTHMIFMNAVEFKGSTTTEKLAPPSANPAGISKGYVYKSPGEAAQELPVRLPRPNPP